VWPVSAAGDAVLAEARQWIGTTEQPPGSNGGPWWDAFGANYGSWCAAFVSMVVNLALGDGSMCQVDSSAGFMLVSSGVLHEYQTGDASSPTGLEAQRTVDLQPGDVVCYSWEAWRWEGTPGSGGYPVCDGGPYDGWTAGDHTGIAASTVDSAGYFRAVEGNTSDTDTGSQDNGGGCYEKTRHISQVCGWWRPIAYGGGSGPEPAPAPTYNLTELGMFLLSNVQRGIWLMGPGYAKGLSPEEFSQAAAIPGIGTFECGDNERAFDLMYGICMGGGMASET
jgi:hypothetical protein